jgi:hypothetical protein
MSTMSSVVVRASRAAAAAASRPSSAASLTAWVQAFRIHGPRGFSTEKIVEKVPKEDYVNGHLLVDHLEYLEDMMDVTLRMEQSMMELHDVYDEKKLALEELSEEVSLDALFEKSAAQKALLSEQIEELKTVLLNAKAFATDGPDGTADGEVREGLREVNRIIDSAAANEDADSIRIQHAYERATNKARARDPEHDW